MAVSFTIMNTLNSVSQSMILTCMHHLVTSSQVEKYHDLQSHWDISLLTFAITYEDIFSRCQCAKSDLRYIVWWWRINTHERVSERKCADLLELHMPWFQQRTSLRSVLIRMVLCLGLFNLAISVLAIRIQLISFRRLQTTTITIPWMWCGIASQVAR